jgi:uncharacterized protein (DUF924 family)
MERREVWFRATAEFDRQLARQFADVHEQAASGAFDPFVHAPEECLALIIALDQFPRNIHRGTARAFATDPKAREIARHAVARGYDRNLTRWPRTFAYLPFEHSEDLVDQQEALVLYRNLNDEESMEHAIGHHDVIERFGRFPHRNAVLGRTNTPDEEGYLKNPPTWGMTAAEFETREKQKVAQSEGGKG